MLIIRCLAVFEWHEAFKSKFDHFLPIDPSKSQSIGDCNRQTTLSEAPESGVERLRLAAASAAAAAAWAVLGGRAGEPNMNPSKVT